MPTPSAAIEAAASFNFDEFSLTIAHPREWRANPDQRTIASPDGHAALVVQAGKPTPGETPEEESLEAWAQQRWGDATITRLPNLDLGGVPNIVFIADATAVPATQQAATISLNLFAQPSDWVYEVTCVTQSPEAFERWQAACDSMIRSIHFISSPQ